MKLRYNEKIGKQAATIARKIHSDTACEMMEHLEELMPNDLQHGTKWAAAMAMALGYQYGRLEGLEKD